MPIKHEITIENSSLISASLGIGASSGCGYSTFACPRWSAWKLGSRSITDRDNAGQRSLCCAQPNGSGIRGGGGASRRISNGKCRGCSRCSTAQKSSCRRVANLQTLNPPWRHVTGREHTQRRMNFGARLNCGGRASMGRRSGVDRSGALGRTRTCNLLIRSQKLYPIELRTHPKWPR